MFENIWRLHPRGAANRGICVDHEGAMLGPACWKRWFDGDDDIEDQMKRQNRAAGERAVEWHFAERPVADLFRKFAEKNGLTNVVVIYTPPRQP